MPPIGSTLATDNSVGRALGALVERVADHPLVSPWCRRASVSGDAAVGQIYDGFGAKARAERSSLKYAFPSQGYVAWMDNVVLLKDAPNRDSALAFMDFLLQPENIAAVSNFARYGSGLAGVEEFLDPELATSPEANPPAGAGSPVFVEVCDEATQAVYDRIWTNVKK